MFKVITGTLQANHISMQITDDTINDDSIFEVYTDTENIIPLSVSVGEHTVTITFDSKPTSNVGVKVLVNNIVGEFAPDTIDAENVTYTNYLVQTNNVKDTLDTVLYEFADLDTELHTDTVLGGVLYHSTTGNIWKKLDASNLDYDTDSTIYSAMGDIDDLTTESKNLVGAINEVKQTASSLPDYSVNEVEMPYKWLDGRSIYRKSYSLDLALSYNNWIVIDSNFNNPNIKFIHCESACRTADNNPVIENSVSFMVNSALGLRVQLQANATRYLTSCTIYYVKEV